MQENCRPTWWVGNCGSNLRRLRLTSTRSGSAVSHVIQREVTAKKLRINRHGLALCITRSDPLLLPVETIPKRGLGCLLEPYFCSTHHWIPAFEGRAQVVVQHLRAYLQQQMGALLGPAHLLFLHHPLAD